MNERGGELARQFEAAIAELADEIERCAPARWQAVCGDEGWTVAATAQHVIAQFPLERRYMAAAAEGAEMPSLTWDDINATNEQRAREQSDCAKAEVLKMLGQDVPVIASYVRGLTDAQLDSTAPLPLANGADVSAQQLIEGGVLIDHVRGHLKSIRAVP